MAYRKNSRPLYEVIQNDIIQKIQDGVYKAGDRIPSEKELVATYQVSRITASKALTELSLSGYITRIQGRGSFANALGSQFNASSKLAPGVRADASEPAKIGLIIPEHSDYHSSNIIRGIHDILRFPAYSIDIVLSREPGSEAHALNNFISNNYQGIILFPTDCEFYSDVILQMHLGKYPLVLIDRHFPGISCDHVICDNELGSKLATDYLLSAGHTKIGFLADSSFKEQVTSIRYSSYVKVMAEHGLPVYPYENFFVDADTEKQKTFIDDIVTRKITAILASNSHVAEKIAILCQDSGICIPGDVSIICFDPPNIVSHCNVDFTHVEQESYEMGCRAARILADDLLSAEKSSCQSVVLKPSLVLRSSVGSPVK